VGKTGHGSTRGSVLRVGEIPRSGNNLIVSINDVPVGHTRNYPIHPSAISIPSSHLCSPFSRLKPFFLEPVTSINAISERRPSPPEHQKKSRACYAPYTPEVTPAEFTSWSCSITTSWMKTISTDFSTVLTESSSLAGRGYPAPVLRLVIIGTRED
jgi:hypothetical protein